MIRLVYTVEFDPGDSRDWRTRLALRKRLVGWGVVEALRRAIVEAISVNWPNDYYGYPPSHEYREPRAGRVTLRIEEVT